MPAHPAVEWRERAEKAEYRSAELEAVNIEVGGLLSDANKVNETLLARVKFLEANVRRSSRTGMPF